MKVFGFAGSSVAEQATLIEGVVPRLVDDGLRVSLIRHTEHDFQLAQPGNDSWSGVRDGCGEVLVSSRKRVALMRELRDAGEPDLDGLVRMLAPCDLVLVEGYRHAPLPKMEVRRTAGPGPAQHRTDPWVVAVASDRDEDTHLRTFSLDDYDAIAHFICRYLALRRRPQSGAASGKSRGNPASNR
ncbi:MAG: molybdopterin-guanine dinucleotide biosynthesis protein B [Aromatoleum sp.]|jgi:molybdopterin-guanine dinucleotide biosynthesis protein B|uniref:molybdopterin-guanine dinucleotide biosynthesis protein B n=1 Tax=Aromatoleum sp. TaxID=2307007 RepID=UPI002895E99D|nr:molybdopterin-guanine dinucleotide biosynthesis protein B [Aromatoleum sp.]MDT3669458.1 molybdopterin-guanine dinucleotide biosynthesis protein B [Aromatoleum sp.]